MDSMDMEFDGNETSKIVWDEDTYANTNDKNKALL